LTEAPRAKIGEAVVTLYEEELATVLGATRGERTAGQGGLRHGERSRTLTTGLGPVTLLLPRAGGTHDWTSRLLPRDTRRAQAVEAALLGGYLMGANTRRI
jgi:transposase-like protein